MKTTPVIFGTVVPELKFRSNITVRGTDLVLEADTKYELELSVNEPEEDDVERRSRFARLMVWDCSKEHKTIHFIAEVDGLGRAYQEMRKVVRTILKFAEPQS